MRRSFEFLDKDTFVLLFKAVIRPILEYGHSVWSPRHTSLQKQVEAVQRRLTKLIPVPGLEILFYPERLRSLNLPTLEHRRIRGDLVGTYRYFHDIYQVDKTRLFISLPAPTRVYQPQTVQALLSP